MLLTLMKILIVEDRTETLGLLRQFLQKKNYLVVETQTAEDAIAELNRETPDVCITDWDLGSSATGV